MSTKPNLSRVIVMSPSNRGHADKSTGCRNCLFRIALRAVTVPIVASLEIWPKTQLLLG